METLHKFPRTPHLSGSRVQPGDESLEIVDVRELLGQFVVVAEKVDGANAAISFGPGGELCLQSRGHFLTGGPRERQFDLFKAWAARFATELYVVLGSRYVLYGEWVFAKHTIFYDQLPHYFLAFDVLDTEAMRFLSASRRNCLLDGSPVCTVPVVWSGKLTNISLLTSCLGPSKLKSPQWKQHLGEQCQVEGLDEATVRRETDSTSLMEGLYVKVESTDDVEARYKLVRGSFLTTVMQSESHWMDRPILPNRLREGTDLFGGGA
jgi:hypothetical protein